MGCKKVLFFALLFSLFFFPVLSSHPVSLMTEILLELSSIFTENHYVAERIFSLGFCGHLTVTLQCGMDDSSLVRIHWLQMNRFPIFLYLVGNVFSQTSQSLLSSLTVILRIQLYPKILISVVFIHH